MCSKTTPSMFFYVYGLWLLAFAFFDLNIGFCIYRQLGMSRIPTFDEKYKNPVRIFQNRRQKQTDIRRFVRLCYFCALTCLASERRI